MRLRPVLVMLAQTTEGDSVMHSLSFQGEDKFEILLQREAAAKAEDGIVVLTLPVFADGFPQSTALVEVILTAEDAEHLRSQLTPAITMARVQERQNR
jgi:hypothetical protein